MKSLEYVKKIREDLNQCFRHWNPATMNNDNDFYRNEWETIQQDLEVLEILKKYLKVITCCEDKEPNKFITLKATIDKWGGERFSNYNDDEKVVSDFNKVKQWLEENNERD